MGSRASGVVLDTHTWLWWAAAEEKLSKRARAAVQSADTLFVSAVSCWEAVMLAQRGRVEIGEAPEDWVRRALALEKVTEVPLDARIAVAAARLELESFHRDPFDMLIYATARILGAPVVTKDRRIRRFDRDLTIW